MADASGGQPGPAHEDPLPLLEQLRLEPPTNDVEICCRFEDIAVEGHAHFAKKEYADAKDCYAALAQLAGQLTRESPLMKSTSHFFLSMACNSLAEEALSREKQRDAEKLMREAEAHSAKAHSALDYNGDACNLGSLDVQLREDYQTFSRKPRIETILRAAGSKADSGGKAADGDATRDPEAGESVTTKSKKKKKKKKDARGDQVAGLAANFRHDQPRTAAAKSKLAPAAKLGTTTSDKAISSLAAATSASDDSRKRKGAQGEAPATSQKKKKANKKGTAEVGGANASTVVACEGSAPPKSDSGGSTPAKKNVPSASKKSSTSDLDSLFGGLSAKKKEKKAEAAAELASSTNTQALAMNDDDGFFDSRGRKSKRKFTPEGFPVYTEDELKISEDAGTTDLCPFDCQCCF
eukprot:m.104490 g.104490  ORF g.104490 m.104490 type:complete len:409 (+) comp12610_c0_seq1:50-1276(+)